MSEYIYGFEPCEKIPEMKMVQREEIVRCEDCKHFTFGSDNSSGSDWCDFHEHIAWSRLGFCAWGKRRGDVE